ncbi:MAG: imidazoleglycerol-phosphate dehydratase [Candidatus Omnitrophica bacterium]|nr:imidazoleglycerol-phosphate dehydratase [Candidatus Omnitrophota bacterium]
MRRANVTRRTTETQIAIRLDVDRPGTARVATGLPFLDHMLVLLATHAGWTLSVKAQGDLAVDVHHTNEDVGLVLGQALLNAVGDSRGIRRFGWAYVPMEDALARVVVDICGRPKLVVRDQRRPRRTLTSSGTAYQWRDLEHCLESFTRTAKLTAHVDLFAGDDLHHTAEAVMKALGRALRQAAERDARGRRVPSSKGIL